MSAFFSKARLSAPARILKRIARPFAIVVIVFILAHSIASAILGRKVEAEIRKIKADGGLVAIADLGKPRVPDSENGAVVYKRAFRIIEGWDAKAPENLAQFIGSDNSGREPALLAQVKQLVAKYAPAFAMVEQAQLLPRCQFAVKWEDGINAHLPHYARIGMLSKLLGADAILKAREGRMHEAVHSLELSFGLTRALEYERLWIAALGRSAVIRTSSKAMRQVLRYGDISGPDARRLYEVIDGIDMSQAFSTALQGERAYCLWVFNDIRRHPWNTPVITSRQTAPPGGFWWRPLGWLWKPVLYADELVWLDCANKGIDAANQKYRELGWKSIARIRLPRYAIISSLADPAQYGQILAVVEGASAELGGSQVALTIGVFKDRYGRYPETLDEIRSKLGWNLPADVFSGRDFVYKPQARLLYSLGMNLKDDNAAVVPARSPKSYLDQQYTDIHGRPVADIVWELGQSKAAKRPS